MAADVRLDGIGAIGGEGLAGGGRLELVLGGKRQLSQLIEALEVMLSAGQLVMVEFVGGGHFGQEPIELFQLQSLERSAVERLDIAALIEGQGAHGSLRRLRRSDMH